MKAIYESPKIEIIGFSGADIICASGDLPQVLFDDNLGADIGSVTYAQLKVPEEND